MYDTSNNAVLIRRDDSQRLFLVFTGIKQRVFGLAPLEFLRASGLQKENAVLLVDPKVTGFLRGCSDELDNIDAVLEWLAELKNIRFQHCRTVICVGVSSGAPAAMLSAEFLGGQASMSFGPRCHALARLGAEGVGGVEVSPTVFERLSWGQVQLWRRLRRRLGRHDRELWPPFVLRAAFADFSPILTRLGAANGVTHHCYYVRRNQPDTKFVEQVSPRIGSRLVRHQIEIPAERSDSQALDEHHVIPILLAQQRLTKVIEDVVREVEREYELS